MPRCICYCRTTPKDLFCEEKEKDEHCHNALKALGRASHMWQDFYGHAVKRTPEVEGGELGDPDNPGRGYGPASYPGEHSKWGEPLDSATQEYEDRKKDARNFVKDKFDEHLWSWWRECFCCCEKH